MKAGRPKGLEGKKLSERNGKLSRRESVFVNEYLVDLNATQAAIRSGYSKKSAMAQGMQILKKPIVAQAVQSLMEERSKKVGIDAEWVLKRLAQHDKMVQEMNDARIEDIHYPDGSLKPIPEWPEVWHRAAMIKGLETSEIFETREVKVKGKVIKKRVLVGYLRKVVRNEFVKEQRETLRTIGLHVGVGAFKESVDPNQIPKEFKITVVHEDGHKETQASPAEVHVVKPNGHGTDPGH